MDAAAGARHVLLHSQVWDPPSDRGDVGRTSSGVLLFVFSVVAIFFAIARVSPNRANALSMHVLMSMKSAADVSPADEGKVAREHAMSSPVGGTCGDGDDRSKYGAPRSAEKCEDRATCGIGGATHGDGDGETKGGAAESAAREHAMDASVGGANEDGEGCSSRGHWDQQ
jgi:hypothetical protein